MNDVHPPPLQSPYGPNAWQQPSRESILIDDTHALMTRATFEQLLEYSSTVPSGAYPGKMWRRHDGAFDAAMIAAGRAQTPAKSPVWLFCWYGRHADPSKVSINYRAVLLA